MSVEYRAGTWTDVCVLPDGRFVQVTTDGPTVRFFVPGWPAPVIVTAPEPLMFCRCAAHDGPVYSIHQGNETGAALLISEHGIVKNLGPTFGVQPVAIDATYAYVVRSNQSYDRITLATGEVEHLPHGVPGSSQGISDINNGIWWADRERAADLGVTLTYPNERGHVTVGQADPPQIAGWRPSGGLFTAFEGEAYEPHIAQSGDRYAIVARTPKGAAFVIVPPFPAFVSGAPAPIPVPVPQPKPEEPKPVSIQLPQNVKSIRDRFVAQFPVPQKVSAGPADDAFENLCRAWVLRLAQTVAALVDTSWGVKNAGGGRPQSKDSLTLYSMTSLINFDLLSGVGTGHPTLVADPQGADITGQTFMPVTPRNWLAPTGPDTLPPGGGPAPQEPPAPTVPADYERRLKAVEDAVAAIEAANSAERIAVASLGEALRLLIASERDDRITVCGALQTFTNSAHQRLDALEQRKYKATGTTSRDFGHSHRLNVTLEAL